MLQKSLTTTVWISFHKPFLGFLYKTFSIPRYSGLHLPLFLSHQCRCVPSRHDPFQKYMYSHPKKYVQWNSSFRMTLPNVANEGDFMPSRRYRYRISFLQNFSISRREQMPYSMKAKSITLRSFCSSHLGRPVL